MQISLRLLIATATVAACASAVAAPVVQQDVRVNAGAYADHVFITGARSAGGVTGQADGSQLYWHDRGTDTAVGALGGSASASVHGVTRLRPIEPHERAITGAIARATLGREELGQSGWTIDLGSQLLQSNVDGYRVAGSSIQVDDFGNARDSDMWFDFTVGLWNGSELVFATALDQLNFTVKPAADSAGVVQHLGGNQFRFLETGRGGSGTSMVVASALDGYHVRTLATDGLGYDGAHSLDDWVDFGAHRTLLADPVAEVPEPSALALVAFGLAGLAWRRRRPA